MDHTSVAKINDNISTMHKRNCAPPDPSDSETDHTLLFEGYSRFHKFIYIRETMVREGCIPPACTVADVEMLWTMSTDEPESRKSDGIISIRMAKKLQNFRDAVDFAFPSHFDTDFLNPAEFTPDFLEDFHRYVGSNGLIADAG
ncbi:hypothetical protein BDK51DRAFT_31259, partial [Blyttiomyces helicus]